jgi:hypothetical protein
MRRRQASGRRRSAGRVVARLAAKEQEAKWSGAELGSVPKNATIGLALGRRA